MIVSFAHKETPKVFCPNFWGHFNLDSLFLFHFDNLGAKKIILNFYQKSLKSINKYITLRYSIDVNHETKWALLIPSTFFLEF